MQRFVAFLTFAYAVAAVAMALGLKLLADRFWPVTALAFAPRWPFALPVIPLILLIAVSVPLRRAGVLLMVSLFASAVMLFGYMDYRLGLGRTSAVQTIRIMTHNIGGTHLTPGTLNIFLEDERIDIAVLQECGLYGDEMTRLGWHFYNRTNLCLLTHYPVSALELSNPMDVWKGGRGVIDRYEIDTPLGRLNLVNVHLETIRDGLESLRARKWRALPDFAANRAECAFESRLARDWCRRGSGSLLVAGDFNLPIESAIYRDNWGDLRNAFSTCGRGFGHTKFTRSFGIRIDHVLMSDAWSCADARVLASPYGGDHVPLVVDLGRR